MNLQPLSPVERHGGPGELVTALAECAHETALDWGQRL